MRTLAPDERVSTVFVYTNNMLVHGDVVVRENIRVSIWLRTQGVPNYVHLFNAQAIMFGGTPPKTYTFEETFVPTAQVIGFHLAPPASDPLDFDVTEANRAMQPVQVLMGMFSVKARLRISTATDLASSLDVMNTAWVSIYEAEITNPYLPQFSLSVPMLLISPSKVNIGIIQ